jgi:hypothetical protein
VTGIVENRKNYCTNCGADIKIKICPYCGQVNELSYGYIKRIWRWLKTEKWYKNPLIVAIVGSIIVATGQIVAVYTQIYTSNEASDFTVSVDTIKYTIFKDAELAEILKMNESGIFSINDSGVFALKSNNYYNIESLNESFIVDELYIRIKDLHHTLKPYDYPIYVTTEGIPKGIKIYIVPSLKTKPPFDTKMRIVFSNQVEIGNYNITIKGIGGNGIERECKVFVQVGQFIPYNRFFNFFRFQYLIDYTN